MQAAKITATPQRNSAEGARNAHDFTDFMSTPLVLSTLHSKAQIEGKPASGAFTWLRVVSSPLTLVSCRVESKGFDLRGRARSTRRASDPRPRPAPPSDAVEA